jgi:hypothetical protein
MIGSQVTLRLVKYLSSIFLYDVCWSIFPTFFYIFFYSLMCMRKFFMCIRKIGLFCSIVVTHEEFYKKWLFIIIFPRTYCMVPLQFGIIFFLLFFTLHLLAIHWFYDLIETQVTFRLTK